MTGLPSALSKCSVTNSKMCMLEENKVCDNCCACFICEIDPTKMCNNCARCVDVARCVRQFGFTRGMLAKRRC